MNHPQHHRFASASLAVVALGLLLTACADMPGSTTSSSSSSMATKPAAAKPEGLKPAALDPKLVGSAREVPVAVRTPLNQAMFLLVAASGVQIYECTPRGAYFGWTFKAPEATWTDAGGAVIGKHFAGPTWTAADGSSVVGTVTATAPSSDASAIPWLLLSVKSTEGAGVLTQTKSIQRLQTIGGVAPTTGCAGQLDAGNVIRVPYAATYAFFRAAP